MEKLCYKEVAQLIDNCATYIIYDIKMKMRQLPSICLYNWDTFQMNDKDNEAGMSSTLRPTY